MTDLMKKQLVEYITKNNDGSEMARTLLKTLVNDLNYADTTISTIGIEDLDNYPNQARLRKVLGKNNTDDYTIEDCRKLADEYEDMFAEDFSENFALVIENLEQQL